MRNITAKQHTALDDLKSNGLKSIEWDEDRGVAAYARGMFGAVGVTPLNAVRDFIQEFGDVFGPADLAARFRHVRTRGDGLGWQHLEFQQTYRISLRGDPTNVPSGGFGRNIDVEGGFLAAHVDAAGELVELQSSCWRDVFAIVEAPIGEGEIRDRLRRSLITGPGLGRVLSGREDGDLDRLVMRGRPTLIVFPFEGGFRLAWSVYGPVALRPGLNNQSGDILPGRIILDAATGERLAEGILGSDVDTPDVGVGVGQLPFGGPFVPRPLQVVRFNTTPLYRLRDTTHSRDIITYDVAGSLPDYFNTGSNLTDGTVPLSADSEGDKAWNRIAMDDSEAERIVSQQPEVDGHYHVGQIYEWYDALAGPGGRAGWDDGNYPSSVPSNMPVHALVHVGGLRAQHYITQNDDYEHVSFLMFGDDITDDGHRAWAASPFVVCHEYQHAITAHSVGQTAPSLLTDGGTDAWPRAITEGISDVFGGLYSDGWYAASDISPEGLKLRNLAFPRDDAVASPGGKDHFADRDDEPASAYPRGQILAHCAYLMSQGGVHQRAGRAPDLIPVHGLGKEEAEGLRVATAARIWYRMMATRFAAVSPYDNEDAFRRIRTECAAAAIDLYGEDSREHRTVIQAFYAVGLHPQGELYGADVTFLQWRNGWRFSYPYLGLPSSPTWASLDLFINNGGASEWNAIVNVAGSEEVFENSVYCRVRNIGDQIAQNVRVTFEYAKHGTAPVVWQTMRDQNGVAQELLVGSLGPGASNFEIDAQDSPPEEAMVTWHIAPLADDEEVDHFCIRANVTADNDVNPFNNMVQSNVAYVSMSARSMAFTIGNPTSEPIPVDLDVVTSFPVAWQAEIHEDLQDVTLPPNEERVVHLDLTIPPDAPAMEPPFDGELRGTMWGARTGPFVGTLTDATYSCPGLSGRFAGRLDAGGLLVGDFEGTIDLDRAEIIGHVTGKHQCRSGTNAVCVKIRACLRPERRVEIRQLLRKEALGGVTFQIQVPMPAACEWVIPPADTTYRSCLDSGEYRAKG